MRTRKLITITAIIGSLALVGCLGGSGGSGGTGPSGYTTELEGTWAFGDSTFQSTWTFDDSSWTILEEYWFDQDTSLQYSGTFTLNTSTSPKQIDMLCTGSPYSDMLNKTAEGIYALNSTATSCTLSIADFSDSEVRPSAFYLADFYTVVLQKR
ncbi:MAG: hypothetical protein GF388_04575 [Candidatus Aegiribacteria sp.]|nr:hypothetical protein [Candidatus Aegiribacteria sp.]MBD3294509.1 hypothetical protein [Candidatus Fermentibacteria bacterium]